MREKVGKSRKHCVFLMIWGSGGSKSRLAKAAGAEPDERWKIARRCGAKHISKTNCTKHTIVGPLLEVEMSKKCTPLWREAHFQVKMHKINHCRTTFGSWDVEKVPLWREAHFEVKMPKNTRGFGFRCRFASLEVQMSLRFTRLQDITLHYTPVHYITLHSSTLHYTTLRSSTLHYTKLHYTTLHCTEWHCNTDRQVDS